MELPLFSAAVLLGKVCVLANLMLKTESLQTWQLITNHFNSYWN